jgi:indolepyruvate ferredoxin oxidoreductase
MPPSFILNRDFVFPSQHLLHELKSRSRSDAFSTLDATRLASALLGDSIAANVFLLGFAFQRGLLPLSGRALYRALELFGKNVAKNKQTFDWGRFTAVSPREVEKMAGYIDESTERAQTLEEIVTRRERFLVDYQDRAYADRYMVWVDRIAALEEGLDPGSRALTEIVARAYFKLLAYKDEYEVARLHADPGFLRSVRKNFGSDFKMKFHLSPLIFSRTDPDSGRPKKYEFGGWVLPVFKLLARCKRLRGTKFDPFSYTRERRMERRLIVDYERLLEMFVAELNAARLDLAKELAALPQTIRGYGPIKDAAVASAEMLRESKLLVWRSSAKETVERESTASAA